VNLPRPLSVWLDHRDQNLCHRQLLVLSGKRDWATSIALTLLEANAKTNTLWVGENKQKTVSINIKDYRSKLGHEFDTLIVDCFSGFRANAVMALSGTIKAQGLMILLCPQLDHWAKYNDPEKVNRISFGFCNQDVDSQFFRYLGSAFTEDHWVALCTQDQFSGSVAGAKQMSGMHNFDEQKKAIEAITRVALGHRNRPLVLTADRGRGKSSALGLAAARLMSQGTHSIWVTASHIGNTEQVFAHAKRMLPTANSTKNNIIYQGNSLSFKPVDQLLNSEENVHIVLVDEAASLPIHELIKLAKKFPRIVFSTTMHGYEGSGRGFEMRFIKELTQLKSDFKRVHLLQPIRWYKNDTLEQFWFNTFFHNVQKNINKIASVKQSVNCCHVSKTQLLSDKKLLANIFKLLIDAHYQTSQDDLQRLLDAPEIQCFILTRGTTLLGVAQIVEEGGQCFKEISDKITDCTRRVKGHLVAQNIASSYNNAPFLLARQWRISRIAIDAEHQRNGLGKQLIDYVEQQARQQHIKFLTVSFGCNTDILKFWNRSEFILAKLSAKPETSSGEHSSICIKPLTNMTLKMADSVHNEFYQEFLYQMDKSLQYMSEGILIHILLYRLTKNFGLYGVCKDEKMIRQFAIGKRAYSTSKRLLKQYLIANPACFSKLATQEQNFLVAALLQNLTDKYLCEKFNLSGKKQIEQTLKRNFKTVLLS
jgi:tRNA(Met) cytidine acetyltransferase